MSFWRSVLLVCLMIVSIHSVVAEWSGSRRIRDIMGGGNLPSGQNINSRGEADYKVLQELKLHNGRLNLYPDNYVNRSCTQRWDCPYTTAAEPSMKLAHRYNVAPVMLFEYYANYYNTTGLGSYSQWYNIGRTFASRFGPGGSFGKENGFEDDYGITYYSAFNEVDDGTAFCPKRKELDPELYIQSIIGLSDGVKSVSSSLRVTTGGWMSINAFKDYNLCGLAPYIAQLLQNGTLDGIDLHTYFNVIYAPMAGYHKTTSAQYNYINFVKHNNITKPIALYSTEFNFNRKYITEELASPVFLTAIWDTLGAVDLNGDPINELALPWCLFNSNTSDTSYGLSNGTDPFVPTRRAQVLQLVLQVAGDLTVTSSTAPTSGIIHATDPDAEAGTEVVVWQNRPTWSNISGTDFVLECGFTPSKVDIYTWQGLWKTLAGAPMPMQLTALPSNQTLMFKCV